MLDVLSTELFHCLAKEVLPSLNKEQVFIEEDSHHIVDVISVKRCA
jgi:hypothetical protein